MVDEYREVGVNSRTRFFPWYILVDLLLWASFFWVHANERWFHTAIPMWVHMPLWCALLGGAVGGLKGRLKPMLLGAIFAALIGPFLILVLFSLAFIGG